ncbi:peptidoglycan-binding domain-containing protein [Myxococcus sp. SDU36]|uniref:peptidoglycan-binding domain-containing protein n=1 Tax=Myxococcus sp. SDU36 TaxID=2831967 RepID=UPI002542C3AE|nr:peptidoglycan-binding domain-containing protein [Myxococcus sp. SDU36]WIG98646.1 peptidoglycan-binding protein [Myxococcus sp. SDU36]
MTPRDEPTTSFAAMDQDIQAEPGTGAQQPGQTVLPCEARRRQRLRLVVRDAYFKAEVGLPYRVEAGATRFDGTIAPDGIIDHLLPDDVEQATLSLWADEARASEPRVLKLRLKKLRPVTLSPGVRQRLANLGFDPGADAAPASQLKKALTEFQSCFGLEPTGTVTPDTERALEQAYAKQKDGLEAAAAWTPDWGTERRNLPGR